MKILNEASKSSTDRLYSFNGVLAIAMPLTIPQIYRRISAVKDTARPGYGPSLITFCASSPQTASLRSGVPNEQKET